MHLQYNDGDELAKCKTLLSKDSLYALTMSLHDFRIGSKKSCALTSLCLGDVVNALIVGSFHFFFVAAVVLGPPNRTSR